MKVFALDIATSTGCALGVAGDTPHCWSHDLGKGRPEEARFAKLMTLVQGVILEHRPDLVAIEAAIGGPQKSDYLVGLVACARGQTELGGVVSELFHLGQIRKHFTGKAWTTRDFPALSKGAAKKAIKSKVIERCRALGWKVPDDDAADAAALWDYACATHQRSHQMTTIGGLFDG